MADPGHLILRRSRYLEIFALDAPHHVWLNNPMKKTYTIRYDLKNQENKEMFDYSRVGQEYNMYMCKKSQEDGHLSGLYRTIEKQRVGDEGVVVCARIGDNTR